MVSHYGYLFMKKHYALRLILAAICLITLGAQASVVMTGTRVIFPSGLSEKTIQFSNPDPQPYIIQLQMTNADNQPDPHAPFILLPPIFRIEPHNGQTARLIANGTSALPQNRESLFYLNFTQLPSIKANLQGKNHLVIAITSRVKVFYRPESLSGNAIDAYKDLRFSIKQGKLSITNPTGFYINVNAANIMVSGNVIRIPQPTLIAPQTTTEWTPEKKIFSLKGATVKLTLVNDYGTDIIKERSLEGQ